MQQAVSEGSKPKFDLGIADGKWVRVEKGVVMDRTVAPVPLDGAEIEDKDILGNVMKITGAREGDDKVVVTMKRDGSDWSCTNTYERSGDSLTMTLLNMKGTTFTISMKTIVEKDYMASMGSMFS